MYSLLIFVSTEGVIFGSCCLNITVSTIFLAIDDPNPKPNPSFIELAKLGVCCDGKTGGVDFNGGFAIFRICLVFWGCLGILSIYIE
jgi:hypothetical protein